MRWYEILITIANIALVILGFRLLKDGMTAAAIACFVTAGVFFIGYMLVVKLLPMMRAKEAFVASAERNGFEPSSEKRDKKSVAWLLRHFPGFDDVSLGVDYLHIRKDGESVHTAGFYSLSGQGLNFGYFLAGAISLGDGRAPFVLDKVHDQKRHFEEQDDVVLSKLPEDIQATLRELPYDFSFRGNFYLVDFDARQLNQDNFAESFDRMVRVLLDLGGGESAAFEKVGYSKQFQ